MARARLRAPEDGHVAYEHDPLRAGEQLVSVYDGPPEAVGVVYDVDGDRTVVLSPSLGRVELAWGPWRTLDEPGAYARFASGVRTCGDVELDIRLETRSVRRSGRNVFVEWPAEARAWRLGAVRPLGVGLVDGDGDLVARRVSGERASVRRSATPADAVVVCLAAVTLRRLRLLPPVELASFEWE